MSFIDWLPFFHAWELRGRFPEILENADGQRFIFVSQMEETDLPSLAVVVNWTAELKK